MSFPAFLHAAQPPQLHRLTTQNLACTQKEISDCNATILGGSDHSEAAVWRDGGVAHGI
jgi:hypothetical protein